MVPILTLAVRQLLLIANWKIGHLKRLFDVYYGGMTQSIEEHYRLSHCYKRPSCQTLSNAFDKSRKTPRTSREGLASKARYYEL